LLRNAAVKVRAAVAALLGVVGCGVGLVLVLQQGTGGLSFESTHELLLATGGFTAVAQAGVLVLTALTLLLVIDTDFTRHVASLWP